VLVLRVVRMGGDSNPRFDLDRDRSSRFLLFFELRS
jgi:hypothetical protein